MGIVISNKGISKQIINCKEEFKVKLSLSAEPSIKSKAKDIVLVLDRSDSMGVEPLREMKKGVTEFLDTLDIESDGVKNGTIGNGSRAALISFSSHAKIDVPYTDSVETLKTAVNALTSDGATNHKEAFTKALEVTAPESTNEKIIIVFTDGESIKGYEGYDEAEAAKAKGITIYSLGYGTRRYVKAESLERWASQPASAYTFITPDVMKIASSFSGLVSDIDKNGATNIKITDKISKCF